MREKKRPSTSQKNTAAAASAITQAGAVPSHTGSSRLPSGSPSIVTSQRRRSTPEGGTTSASGSVSSSEIAEGAPCAQRPHRRAVEDGVIHGAQRADRPSGRLRPLLDGVQERAHRAMRLAAVVECRARIVADERERIEQRLAGVARIEVDDAVGRYRLEQPRCALPAADRQPGAPAGHHQHRGRRLLRRTPGRVVRMRRAYARVGAMPAPDDLRGAGEQPLRDVRGRLPPEPVDRHGLRHHREASAAASQPLPEVPVLARRQRGVEAADALGERAPEQHRVDRQDGPAGEHREEGVGRRPQPSAPGRARAP